MKQVIAICLLCLSACAVQSPAQQPMQLPQILQNLKQLQLPITAEKLETATGLALSDPKTQTHRQVLPNNPRFDSYTMPPRSQVDEKGMRGFSLNVNSNSPCFDKQQLIAALGVPTQTNGVMRHQMGNSRFEPNHSFSYAERPTQVGQLYPNLGLSYEGTLCLLKIYLIVEESRGVQ